MKTALNKNVKQVWAKRGHYFRN